MGVARRSFLWFRGSLVPRPRPPKEEKGLVTVEQFLGCADSAVLVLGKPIRSLYVTVARDLTTVSPSLVPRPRPPKEEKVCAHVT